MRQFYLFLFLSSFLIRAAAQTNYEASAIPKELLSHASAVVRSYETTVEVKALDDVNYHYKLAVTVLNKNGDQEARISIFYDKVNRLKSFKGAIYDENGKLSGKIKEGDLNDHSYADGYSLFVDDRYKSFTPAITTYPYTVEYEYEMVAKQTMLPDWDPYPREAIGTSVEHSGFKLICKTDFSFRHKEINYTGKIVTGDIPGFKTYAWEINNQMAQRYEPFSPADRVLLTSVKLAPDKFIFQGVEGMFTNWKEYGDFVNTKLLKGRQALSPETVAIIKGLTADIADPKLKAKKIYEYVQQKTRYVGVQIGIGGYQPFLADEVDRLSYGDCKALVNYTQSLLTAVGIPSYYVINHAGSDKASALPDFASINEFNHIILCLPFKNDTTWIDCTSKENPFGYLGDFTDDRLVLACTPDGGKLMRTPKYKTTDNTTIRQGNFTLTADGTLDGGMKTEFRGVQYDDRDYMLSETFTEQVKKAKETYPIENLEIKSLQLKQDKSLQPVTTETIALSARDYVAQNGGRFFFIPNTANRLTHPLKNVINRQNPVYISHGYVDEDEITYTLPASLKVTSQLLKVDIDKPFGKYKASMQLDGNKLVYKRWMQLNDGTYSKDTYADMVDFYQTVFEADNYTLTMEKK